MLTSYLLSALRPAIEKAEPKQEAVFIYKDWMQKAKRDWTMLVDNATASNNTAGTDALDLTCNFILDYSLF